MGDRDLSLERRMERGMNLPTSGEMRNLQKYSKNIL
jgi:hypothetical protein